MKKQLIAGLLMATTIAFAAGGTANKFGLVYQGAVSENVKGKVNVKPVSYEVNGIKVAGVTKERSI